MLLLGLKVRQTRHEERDLVIPNERGITLNGVVLGLTRRAVAPIVTQPLTIFRKAVSFSSDISNSFGRPSHAL